MPEWNTDEIVDAWIADLSRSGRGEGRSEDLVGAYRDLGLAVVRQSLASAGEPRESTSDARELERSLGRLASAIRRSRLRISEALEDLSLLEVATIAALRARIDGTGATHEILDVMARVVGALDAAVRGIVRVLESRALRAERERSEAMAAMTDQLSHELHNRLGAARTASQMLVNPDIELDEHGLERVAELVEASVESALDTVGDVRALHGSDWGPREVPVRSAQLPRLIRAVIDDLSPTALDAGVEILVEGEIEDIEVDAARLRLVVYNLVGNGIKYRSPERDSWVRVRTQRLETGEVELRVIDNGIGIAEDELEDVFLYRVRGSEAEHVPGSGVGLAIVLEAIEQIGGEIDVASELGAGTTFTVTFAPLQETEP